MSFCPANGQNFKNYKNSARKLLFMPNNIKKVADITKNVVSASYL